jgi:DNA-binding GntR family transcriptional regulator
MLPNLTLRVPSISLQMLEELADARATVEGRAAALAATRMTNADFSKIKAANERYGHALDAGDIAAAVVANEEMHHAIYRAAGSPVLLSISETLWLQSGPYKGQLFAAGKPKPAATPVRRGQKPKDAYATSDCLHGRPSASHVIRVVASPPCAAPPAPTHTL